MKSNFQERRVGCCAERVATTRSPEPFDGGWPYDDVYDEGCKHLSLEGISQELVFRLYAVAECCGDWARLVSFGLRRETLLTLSFKVYDMFS